MGWSERGERWKREEGRAEGRTNPPTRSETGIIQLALFETKKNAPYFR
jgi:hypothetical protein